MKKEELQKLETDELKKKEKGTKTLIGIFIPLTLALFFFPIRDYLRGEEADFPVFIIAICTLGGLLSVLPQLKAIQAELKERNG